MLKNKNKGFTIVELLIVIVVIGVLAAISIAAFNGVQNKSKDAKQQSDIRNIAQQLEIFYQDNGYFPPYQQSSVGIGFTSWRTANLPNMNDGLLTPPGATTVSLVNGTAPAFGQYGYSNAGSCSGTQCPKYRVYWRSYADGQVKTYTGSTG